MNFIHIRFCGNGVKMPENMNKIQVLSLLIMQIILKPISTNIILSHKNSMSTEMTALFERKFFIYGYK